MNWIKIRFKGFLAYKELLGQLVVRDIKLKYRRSFLGYLWSILNPLLIMMVTSFVFAHIFRFEIPNFAVYILTGQVLFNFMSEATTMAINSITSNGSLIKKTYVPKYIFTLSKVTSSLVNLLLAMIALWIMMIATGVPWTPWFFFFPVVVLELYVFCIGLGLFLAQAAVFFRDIQYIYGVLLTAWMYLTPVIYPITSLPENFKPFVLFCNPMTYYVTQFRDSVLYGQAPEAYLVYGGVAFAIGFVLLGAWSFIRSQDRFILYI